MRLLPPHPRRNWRRRLAGKKRERVGEHRRVRPVGDVVHPSEPSERLNREGGRKASDCVGFYRVGESAQSLGTRPAVSIGDKLLDAPLLCFALRRLFVGEARETDAFVFLALPSRGLFSERHRTRDQRDHNLVETLLDTLTLSVPPCAVFDAVFASDLKL